MIELAKHLSTLGWGRAVHVVHAVRSAFQRQMSSIDRQCMLGAWAAVASRPLRAVAGVLYACSSLACFPHRVSMAADHLSFKGVSMQTAGHVPARVC